MNVFTIIELMLLLQIIGVFSNNSLETVSEDLERINSWNRLEEELEYNIANRAYGVILVVVRSVITAFLSNIKVDVSAKNFGNVTNLLEVAQDEARMLTTGRTLRETAELCRKNKTYPAKNELPKMLKAYNPILHDFPTRQNDLLKRMELRVYDAINRALNFYQYQLDDINKGDTSLALLLLKDIDDKHGKIWQQKFPLDEWINRVCESTSGEEGDYCNFMARQWTTNSRKNKLSADHWKSAQLIHNLVNQTDDKVLENVGSEKDGMWGPLNGQCQMALVKRCEIPYVCERTLLDPTPRSQYLLTHQLLQRLLVDTVDCPNTKNFVSGQDIYTSLCTKMYMEAKYLHALDVPVLQRDLFAEYVGLCGYMGYTNFIREDWVDKIISWQSKSDNGCFVKDPLSPIGIITSDFGFKRRATQKELDQGIQQPNEKCLPHFTAVSLIALSAHWDYLMDAKAI